MVTLSSNPLSSGVSAELYRALIGPRSQDYYLRQFTRFDEVGKAGPSWNWMAYWATLNWLVYRRMWGWALAYVAAVAGVVLVIFGAGKVVLDYGDLTAVLLSLLLLAVAFVVPAVYGNSWFYTHSNTKITAALREAKDVNEARGMLARQAGSDRRLMVIAAVNAAVLVLAYLVASWMSDADSSAAQAPVSEPPPVAAARSGRIQDLSPPAPTLPTAGKAPVDAPAATPVNTPINMPVSAPASGGAGAEMTPAASVPAAASPVLLSPTPLIVAGPETPATAAAAPPPAATAKPEPAPAQVAPAQAAPTKAAPAPAVAATPVPAPEPLAQVPAPAAEAAPPAAARKPPVRSRYPLQYVWVLQVGAFEQPANAQQVVEQIQSLGLDAGAAPYQTPEGPVLMRVRLGPYETRRDADLVALRLKALNLPVLVLRQRP